MQNQTPNEHDAIPLPALLLGLSGLIPFAFGALAIIGVEVLALHEWLAPDYFVDALIAYGAVILSFLGGVRWGAAMARDHLASGIRSVEEMNMLTGELVLAILPSLIGWGAFLVSPVPGLALLAVAFVLIGIADRAAARDERLPSWYGRLRRWLTIGVATSLSAALFAKVLL